MNFEQAYEEACKAFRAEPTLANAYAVLEAFYKLEGQQLAEQRTSS